MKSVILFLLMVGLLADANAYADAYDYDEVEIDGIRYGFNRSESTCEVLRPRNRNVITLEIPPFIEVDGKKLSVVSIKELAFCSCADLTSVVISI